ncbi:hypothetical protein [Corynebacterium glyciniphilum]|uniref:hypothetical protein n=1 Tax=Corynebacterium glyciniphilum TaxID=1404244 RepID=UPI002356566E
MTVPDTTTPFTVLRGRPDEAETEAIGRALAVVIAEAADAASASAGSDPREINRMRARTTSRGTWGTPAEQLAGHRNATGTFNPTGFRV